MRILKSMTAVILALCLLFSGTVFAFALESDDFTYTVSEDGNGIVITGYTGSQTNLVIPSVIDEKPVISIGKKAFENQYNITSIEFPETLLTIDDYAFRGCSKINNLQFPDSLVSIGVESFFNCAGLMSISLSENTYNIGYQAFHNTGWFTQSPNGPLYLGLVFYHHKGIIEEDSFTVRDFTKAIAPEAFKNQLTVTEINLPVGLRKISAYAFSYCTNLRYVRIPSSVTEIEGSLFLNAPVVSVKGVLKSSIHSYTSNNGIGFIYDSTLDYFDGDLDKNNKVDSTDCRLLMRLINGSDDEFDNERYLSCNIVYDGKIDTKDLREWMRRSLM